MTGVGSPAVDGDWRRKEKSGQYGRRCSDPPGARRVLVTGDPLHTTGNGGSQRKRECMDVAPKWNRTEDRLIYVLTN